MSEAGLVCPFSRTFRRSPWMRSTGNALTSKFPSSTSASSLSFSASTSASRMSVVLDSDSMAIQSPTSTPPAMPMNHRRNFKWRLNTNSI